MYSRLNTVARLLEAAVDDGALVTKPRRGQAQGVAQVVQCRQRTPGARWSPEAAAAVTVGIYRWDPSEQLFDSTLP